MYKYYVLVLLLIHLASGCFSQVDTNKIIFNSRLMVLNDLHDSQFAFENKNDFDRKYDDFTKESVNFIKSKGFNLSDTSFYFISIKINKEKQNDSLDKNNLYYNRIFPFSEYIIGAYVYRGGYRFFRLKGFSVNDFNVFLKFITLTFHDFPQKTCTNLRAGFLLSLK